MMDYNKHVSKQKMSMEQTKNNAMYRVKTLIIIGNFLGAIFIM